jgi:hypothetical protein
MEFGSNQSQRIKKAFIMAKEIEKAAGCAVRVLNPHRLAIICATDKEPSESV